MNVMRERRLRAAIPTQQEVAKAMGVQVSTISARLALPAEARALRARRLRRPARRARGLYEGFCLIDAGQKYTPQYYSSMEKTLPFTSRRTAVSAISLAL